MNASKLYKTERMSHSSILLLDYLHLVLRPLVASLQRVYSGAGSAVAERAADESAAAKHEAGAKKKKGPAGAAVPAAPGVEASQQELTGHSQSVSSVVWPTAETIVSGSWDNTVCAASVSNALASLSLDAVQRVTGVSNHQYAWRQKEDRLCTGHVLNEHRVGDRQAGIGM